MHVICTAAYRMWYVGRDKTSEACTPVRQLASSEAGRVESILRLVLNRVERLGWVRGRTPVQVGVLRARRCGASTEVEQTDKMELTRARSGNTSNEQRDLAVRAAPTPA